MEAITSRRRKIGNKRPATILTCRRRRQTLNPNSEVAVAALLGGTGHWPVPSGGSPLGTETAREFFLASVSRASVLPVPSGQWPDGTGGSPAPLMPVSEFGMHRQPVQSEMKKNENHKPTLAHWAGRARRSARAVVGQQDV